MKVRCQISKPALNPKPLPQGVLVCACLQQKPGNSHIALHGSLAKARARVRVRLSGFRVLRFGAEGAGLVSASVWVEDFVFGLRV